jgi:hypothetical protein
MPRAARVEASQRFNLLYVGPLCSGMRLFFARANPGSKPTASPPLEGTPARERTVRQRAE